MALDNGHGDGEGNRNTVFVDTSLDTHLATTISDSDTVSDLKRRIMLEHRQCFPAIGDIKVHCLKVKRRRIYYHLIDSMLVKSAFQTSQKNWFLSVDASLLEQCDGIQHKPVDQLTLPWVKDNGSTDKHDSQADRPSNISLIHGSPSNHPKIVPFVNQKVPSVVDHFASDESPKIVSKNVEEDRSFHGEPCRNLEPELEQQLDSNVKKETKSKKRTRDVHNDDTYVKRRRKAQKTEGDEKVLEEERVITDDVDKVKDMGTIVNDETSIEDRLKSKDAGLDGVVTKAMDDEHTRTISISQKKPKRTRKGKNSAHDQVATVVPSSVENAGEDTRDQKKTEASEVMPDVAMVVEKNILEEMPFQLSQKEKDNELVQEADIGNEIPSSPMRTSDCEHEEPKDELLVKHADDPMVDTSSTVPTPLIDEKIIDEQTKDYSNMITDEKNQVSEKTLGDDALVVQDKKDDDDLIVKEVNIAKPTESHRSRTRKEKSRKEIKDTAGSRKKKKDVEKSALRKDNTNDAANGTNEESNLSHSVMKEKMTSADALHVDHDDITNGNDAEISNIEIKGSQLIEEIPEKQNYNKDDMNKSEKKKDNDAEISKNEIKESLTIAEIPEKQNDNMGDIKKTKQKKKSKTKKSSARNEGESLTKPDNGDLHEMIADVSQVDVSKDGDIPKSKDAEVFDEVLVKTPKKNHKSPSTPDLESEKIEIPKEPSKTMPTESEVFKGNDVNSEVDITKEGSQGIDFHEYFSPSQQQPNKFTDLDNVDNRKDTKSVMKEMKEKKLKKKSKEEIDSKNNSGVVQSLSRNENKNLPLSPKKVPGVSTNGVGAKDRNVPVFSKTKTPKPTTKIDTLKTSKPGSSSQTFDKSLNNQRNKKQQPFMSQSQVKNLKKSVPGGKSLLNTPGRSIFDDDSDDSSADDNANSNSNSSTRTPSSSSAESDSSIDSKRYGSQAVKRKQGDGRNNMNSQSRLQNRSMADLLRSSSRFKKARVTASQQMNNTESEPVDFVPDSQPVA